jgi:hypothetical protein
VVETVVVVESCEGIVVVDVDVAVAFGYAGDTYTNSARPNHLHNNETDIFL